MSLIPPFELNMILQMTSTYLKYSCSKIDFLRFDKLTERFTYTLLAMMHSITRSVIRDKGILFIIKQYIWFGPILCCRFL